MTWEIIYTEQYNKKAAKFIKRHPDVLSQYQKTLELLSLNPHHLSLRLHELQGKFEGLSRVSINMKYRITLEMIVTPKEIILINIGDHDQVY
jgi:addiction module RelE/StbE family toxin